MVLILSDSNDVSTQEVTDWLLKWNVKFIRVCQNDLIEINYVSISDQEMDFEIIIKYSNDNIKLKYSDITFYWYRRANFNIKWFRNDSAINNNFLNKFRQYLVNEFITISEAIHFLLKLKPHLGSIFDNDTNKLNNLIIARNCGLSIPNCIIGDNNTLTAQILDEKFNFITKAFRNGFYSIEAGLILLGLTKKINKKDLLKEFNYSFLQKQIFKKFDVRIFYINKIIYASAIFSQSDKQTKVDFRNYNKTIPNRVTRIKLPINIEKKIINFMNIVGMKSGSIDLIYSTENKFYFLEVNPVGQFKQVSFPCNYSLEKVIAKTIYDEKLY